MRAPLIRVRTRGQEPCCSSVSQLQGGGPSGEGRGGEAQSPDPALPKAHTSQAARPQHLSCNSLCTERLKETCWEPRGFCARQVTSPSPAATCGISKTPVLETGVDSRAGDPQNQLSCAGGLLSATHSSCSAWPSEMRIDEAFCRILRALRESAAGELGEAEVSSSLLSGSPGLTLSSPSQPGGFPLVPGLDLSTLSRLSQCVWASYLQGRLGVSTGQAWAVWWKENPETQGLRS